MTLTVLFDLDETLLRTNAKVFLPAYFKALGKALSFLGSEEEITNQIKFAVSRMISNQDPGKLLRDVFSDNFYHPLGTSESACQEPLAIFYNQAFPKLQKLTEKQPGAIELVEWCKSKGLVMAIATNPLFPKTATYQRIRWAGLDPQDFVFYSSYDTFHFTKPHLAFYAEVLGRLGWPDSGKVMVGDNLTADLLPVEHMGFNSYWVDPRSPTDRHHGSLADAKIFLQRALEAEPHKPADDPEVHLAVLTTTPAAFDTWIQQVPEQLLKVKPSRQEWSINEVLWHMADIERDVNIPQWEQFLSDPSQTIMQPNTSDWAVIRGYQDRTSREAYQVFLDSRKRSISLVNALIEKGLYEEVVSHVVFSELKVAELIAFSAKHDRLHLGQCINLLNIY